MVLVVKNLSANANVRDVILSLGQEDLLEEGMTTYSSILARRIPCSEEPSGLQSMGPQRVRHYKSDLAHTHVLINGVIT